MQRAITFLGRSIKHEWIVDGTSQQNQWYDGTVVSVLSGTDGDLNAVYEVLYEGEVEAYKIDHLIQDCIFIFSVIWKMLRCGINVHETTIQQDSKIQILIRRTTSSLQQRTNFHCWWFCTWPQIRQNSNVTIQDQT